MTERKHFSPKTEACCRGGEKLSDRHWPMRSKPGQRSLKAHRQRLSGLRLSIHPSACGVRMVLLMATLGEEYDLFASLTVSYILSSLSAWSLLLLWAGLYRQPWLISITRKKPDVQCAFPAFASVAHSVKNRSYCPLLEGWAGGAVVSCRVAVTLWPTWYMFWILLQLGMVKAEECIQCGMLRFAVLALPCQRCSQSDICFFVTGNAGAIWPHCSLHSSKSAFLASDFWQLDAETRSARNRRDLMDWTVTAPGLWHERPAWVRLGQPTWGMMMRRANCDDAICT